MFLDAWQCFEAGVGELIQYRLPFQGKRAVVVRGEQHAVDGGDDALIQPRLAMPQLAVGALQQRPQNVETVGEGLGRDAGDGINIGFVALVTALVQPGNILFHHHFEFTFRCLGGEDFSRQLALGQVVDDRYGFG